MIAKICIVLHDDDRTTHDDRSYVEVTLWDSGWARVDLHGVMINRRDVTGFVDFCPPDDVRSALTDSFEGLSLPPRTELTATRYAAQCLTRAKRYTRDVLKVHRRRPGDTS